MIDIQKFVAVITLLSCQSAANYFRLQYIKYKFPMCSVLMLHVLTARIYC